MGFEIGHQLSKGRPKGSQNKDLKALRERVADLLEGQFDKIVDDMDSLTPKERVDAYIKLIEFVVPKLQRSAIETHDVESMTIKVESWADRFRRSAKDEGFVEAINIDG